MTERVQLDPNERCPASGLTNRECMASICDCFPQEPDRFGIHPEYFVVYDEVARFIQTGQLDPPKENER